MLSGVLTDLYLQTPEAKEKGHEWKAEERHEGVVHLLQQEADITPDVVTHWAGLTDANPQLKITVDGKELSSGAATFNDGQSGYVKVCNFNEIAKAIEETL